MNAKRVQTKGLPQAVQWWSIVQAVAWVVERSERAVERAIKVPLLRSLPLMTPRLVPTSAGDLPPVSLAAAPDELLRAARARRITIQGRLRGVGELERVLVQLDDRLRDHKGAPCIGGADVYRGGRFWSDFSIRSDECMGQWPSPGRAPHVNSAKIEVKNARAASRTTRAPRKPGVAEKDDSDLMEKVQRAMGADKSLTRYAAVRRHCGETTQKGIEAAYKRIGRKIDSANTP
jgi:hypothetical protein